MTGVLGRGILKQVREEQRVERRRRFVLMRIKFERERPGESPVKLIAEQETRDGRPTSRWTVYSVFAGRR
jgi:hypothetical protein